jgi:hypothetical protein
MVAYISVLVVPQHLFGESANTSEITYFNPEDGGGTFLRNVGIHL